MILETSDKQIAANALYRNYGFVGIKQEIIDGYNCTWYEKKLNKEQITKKNEYTRDKEKMCWSTAP